MKLSDISVERPVSVIMVVLLLMILGTVSFAQLPVELLPSLELPFAVIMTESEGASPEEIEETITRPIENSLAVVDGVEDIIAISNPDNSFIITEFDWGTDMDFAMLDLRESLDLVEDFLPESADSPMVLSFDPDDMPIMQIAVTGDEDLDSLRRRTENELVPLLERNPGVASADLTGGLEREIQVNLDPEALENYGMEFNLLAQSIAGENINLSGGTISHGNRDLLIRTDAEFENVNQLRELDLMNSQGQKFSLSSVANIEDTFKERDSYNYLNGQESIILSIQQQSGSNTVQVANAVKEEVENFNASNMDLEILLDQSEFIEQAISNLQQDAIIGGILAIVILLLFLKSIKSTIVIATAIPISIVTAVVFMYFADLSINLITLGGIALGLGMLVDNSIVVLENIYRFNQEGYGRIEAAKKGTAEVGTAILASTLTTAAVFLPVIYIEGLASQLFGPLALAVTFSLLASLVVAFTVIPMLSSKILTVKEKVEEKSKNVSLNKIESYYRKLLSIVIKRRYITLILVALVVILFASGIGLGIIPLETEFIPQADEGMYRVNIELAQGRPVEESNRIVKEIEELIMEDEEVDNIYSSVGGSDSHTSNIQVELVELAQRERATSDVVSELRKKVDNIAGAEITVREVDGMMGGAGAGQGRAPIEVSVQGPDLDTLSELGEDVKTEIEQVEGAIDSELSLTESRPEVQVDVNRARASDLGFSAGEIANTIRTAVSGQVISRYKEAGEEYDIRMQLERDRIENLNQLGDLKLTSAQGKSYPLSQLADIELATGLSSIERQGQQRIIRVLTFLEGRSLGAVESDIRDRVEQLDLPPGYTVSYGGEIADLEDTFGDLTFALILAVILVYMVMASQFESLVHPFTIIFSVPLAIVGAIFGLVITGIELSVVGFIGMITLAGIVVNNAIVLVDYINVRRENESRDEAILNAGPIRLRPILMTALTTILALVPLSLGIGEGAEIQQPLAVVVISGLLSATVLTLVIIPALYAVLDDIGSFVKRILKKTILNESEEIEA